MSADGLDNSKLGKLPFQNDSLRVFKGSTRSSSYLLRAWTLPRTYKENFWVEDTPVNWRDTSQAKHKESKLGLKI